MVAVMVMMVTVMVMMMIVKLRTMLMVVMKKDEVGWLTENTR